MKNQFSRIALLISAFVILAVVLAFPRYERPATEATLSWDVSGYYLYLPAIFIYQDLKELKFLPGIIEKYQPSYTPDQAYPKGEGSQVMKYSAGMALLYLPFFLIGHLVASLTDYPADGFSLPYQAAIHLGSVLVAVLGLWFLRKNLLHFFSDRVTGLTLLLIALGTNFLNYATFDAAMPHVYLFLLLSLLLHFTLRWHATPNFRDAFFIGACIGLAALTRPTEVIFAIVPVFWGVTSVKHFKEKLIFFTKKIPQLLLAAATVATIGFIQIAYWKIVTGDWIVYSYQEQGFKFHRPHFADVLFSFRKGWFVYTPLMVFAVAGFYFLVKHALSPLSTPLTAEGGPLRKMPASRVQSDSPSELVPNSPREVGDAFLPIFLFFIVNTWIVSSWDVWWYGGAFGQRAMIPSYALLAFPLAALLSWISNLTKTVAVTLSILLAACLILNLFQTYQAHWGPWEADMMNRAYYWRIFGKTEINPYDKLLLDAKEGFSGERKNPVLIYHSDFENRPDTTGLSAQVAYSGQFSVFTDPQRRESVPVYIPSTDALQPGKMLHIIANFSAPQLELEPWWMPQFVLQFEKNGASVHERIIRPGRLLSPNEWRTAWMDIEIPDEDFDRMKIFLRNPRNVVSLFMDDLRVEMFEK